MGLSQSIVIETDERPDLPQSMRRPESGGSSTPRQQFAVSQTPNPRDMQRQPDGKIDFSQLQEKAKFMGDANLQIGRWGIGLVVEHQVLMKLRERKNALNPHLDAVHHFALDKLEDEMRHKHKELRKISNSALEVYSKVISMEPILPTFEHVTSSLEVMEREFDTPDTHSSGDRRPGDRTPGDRIPGDDDSPGNVYGDGSE